MAKNVLYLACGLALGLIIAALFYIVADPSRSEEVYDPGDSYETDPRLERGLAGLSREIARLAEAVDGLRTPPMTQEAGAPAGPTLEIFTDWISVTDKELAAVLVENGTTPYDPGLAPLVREAAEKLREADRLHGESSVARSDLYLNKGLTKDAYMAEIEANRKRHQQKREEILNDLRKVLEGL